MTRTLCDRYPASRRVPALRISAAMMPVALRRLVWLVLLCALIGPSGAPGAMTPAQTCAAAKLKAAGKEIGGKMRCYAKAKKAGVAVDGNCLSTQRTKADAQINKADGACSGTAAAIDAAVDDCVTRFLNEDPGNCACPAASAQKIGKGGKAELGCQAKEVSRPGTFGVCDAKEDGKTATGLGNAGGCVDPAAVLADIDNCDTAIDAIIEPTSTTTTTLPLACSLCAPEAPPGILCSYPPLHVGPGDACVDAGSCELSGCSSDSDCVSGKICLGGYPVPLGCVTICCSPCASDPRYPCVTSEAPTCGGTCPSGQVCGEVLGGNSCECVRSDQTCLISQAPACGGTCPSGQVCGQATGGGSCECVPSDDTCTVSQAPACGGTCPARLACAHAPRGDACST